MKKSFSGLGTKMVRLLAAVGAIITGQPKSFNAPEANPIRRSNKSSGGRAKARTHDERYRSWKKLFGGLAVPRYQG